MSEPRRVGFAMWGNRPPPQMPELEAVRPGGVPTQPEDPPYPARVAIKDAVSIGLALIGDALIVVGSALEWGGPIAVIVGGVSVLIVGLLIGVAA